PREAGVPPADTHVNAAYHVAGSPARVQGDLRFEPSTIAGAKIAAGSTAAFAVNGKDIAYKADATVADLDLQRLGTEFGVPALAVDRYKSTINGHIVADGRGTTPQSIDLTASGPLEDTSIL